MFLCFESRLVTMDRKNKREIKRERDRQTERQRTRKLIQKK